MAAILSEPAERSTHPVAHLWSPATVVFSLQRGKSWCYLGRPHLHTPTQQQTTKAAVIITVLYNILNCFRGASS